MAEGNDEHRDCYRRCFGTPDGRKVLGYMLIDMGYFDGRAGDSELRNYAAGLMQTLGFTDGPKKVEQLVEKCFEISQE